MQSYSKGARGLSVLPRVHCIFTAISISLSLGWRQRGHRYAIRAGRNLPDKEFRYLRTVIVTAAVHRGFDQGLAPHQLTFRHRAGVTPYTSSFEFAECCVFIKQSQPPGFCGLRQLHPFRLHQQRRTFSRSYGTILPSSFTRVLSSALVCSTCPPVSVSGTVVYKLTLVTFPGSMASVASPSLRRLLITPQSTGTRISLSALSTRLYRFYQSPAQPSLLRPHLVFVPSAGILTCFPSTTRFRLALGADSPRADLHCARKPWTFGVRDSHPHYRYSCQHSHF